LWELPPLSLDEAKELMSSDFGRELVKLAVDHMTHFTFGVVNSRGHAEIRSATCFFLKTPSNLLVVTAKHVISAYKQARADKPETICQIGNLRFEPCDRLVGMGTKADIATLSVTGRELEKIGKRPITHWPPAPPDSDDRGVLLAGYPATETVMEGPRTGSFGIYFASAVAQRTTEWQLSCQVEWNNVQPIPGLGTLPPPGFDTGGMSGGPVFAIQEQNGILSFPLAGVISEGQPAWDTIIADRADFIRADGSVRV
jgi:hypothetical protein